MIFAFLVITAINYFVNSNYVTNTKTCEQCPSKAISSGSMFYSIILIVTFWAFGFLIKLIRNMLRNIGPQSTIGANIN